MPTPLVTHLGLGDAILQTGMAVKLLERYEEIGFPCYTQYEASVRSFFVNYPRIKIYTIEHQNGWDWGSPPNSGYYQAIERAGMDTEDLIRAGIYHGTGIGWDFSKSFYDQCGVDYRHRWDSCPIRDAATKVAQIDWNGFPKLFVHDDPARRFNITKINKKDAFHPASGEVHLSILRYANLLKTADKRACIDSAFFHLADCFDLQGESELHRYPRWPRPRDFRYQSRNHWKYVD